jgi:hypothetical protein
VDDKLEIADTYGNADVPCIQDGQTVTWDGRPVHLRDVITRRWGWPKSSALMAAMHLKDQAREHGHSAVVWIRDAERDAQQRELYAAIPDLLRTQNTGLANRSSREAYDADHELIGVNISFRRSVSDDGMVNFIIGALARRFACAPNDMRAATNVNTSGTVAHLLVDAERFEVLP